MCLSISMMGAVTLGLGGDANAFFTRAVTVVFPDIQIFNVAETFAFAPVNMAAFFGAFGYAAIYICACAALASWLFSKREF